MMRKFLLVFLFIGLITPPLMADTESSNDPFKLITFTVTPFVRVGFARVEEHSAAAPSTNLTVLEFDDAYITDDGRQGTDTGHLYCQVFTNDSVELKFSSTLLNRTSTALDNSGRLYHWTAVFKPTYGDPQNGTANNTLNTADSSKDFITLFSEDLTSEQLNKPRIYWWDFNITLNSKSYEAPAEAIFGEMIVEVVTK